MRTIRGCWLTALCLAVVSVGAQEFEPPKGWKVAHIGADDVASPTDLRSGERFQVLVKPPVSATGDLSDWLRARIEEDAAGRGKRIRDDAVQVVREGQFCAATKVYEKDGEQLLFYYAGIARPDGKRQMAVTTTRAKDGTYQRYARETAQIMIDLMQGRTARKTTPAPSQPSPRQPAPTKVEKYATVPGKGLKASQIEGVFMYQGYQMGVGGYTYVVYRPYLLLKDGTFWKRFDVAPADLDVAKSRSLDPEGWGKWKRERGNFLLTEDGVKWRKERMQEAKPGKSGDRFNGYFSHIGGGGDIAFGGGTMIASVSGFQFFSDGRFDLERHTSGSVNEPGAQTTVGSSRSGKGAYSVDGYTITFRFSDGRVERKAFAYMDEKEKDALYIGSVVFLKKT